jgi:hypothetical protein
MNVCGHFSNCAAIEKVSKVQGHCPCNLFLYYSFTHDPHKTEKCHIKYAKSNKNSPLLQLQQGAEMSSTNKYG